MRPLLLIAMIACAGAPPARSPRPARTFDCSVTTWTAYETIDQRARLGEHVVSVLDVDRDEVLLASVTGGVIIARWFPASSLAAVVTKETLLAPAEGAAGDPAIRVRPGLAMPARGRGHVHVQARGRVRVDGWVPASVRGRTWTAAVEEPRWRLAPGTYVVRAAPDPAAPIRARLQDAFVQVRAGTERWFEVTAGDDTLVVDGFIERPSPREVEGSEGESIDEPPPEYVATHTCLFDAPGGAAAGMVVGYVANAPRSAPTAGWQALRVTTAWGARDYFFPTPPPVEETEWKFDRW